MPPTASDLRSQNTHDQYSQHTSRLYVFEGAADCLSHASIAQISGADWNGYRLSLGGVSSLALANFLDNNPQVSTVYLCLDNDKPGKEATERICAEILANEKYNHISIYTVPPPVGKDYNDVLVFMQEKVKERNLQAENTTAVDKQDPSPAKKRTDSAR